MILANRSAVTIDGAVSDLHLRVDHDTVTGLPAVRWCGVYVHPTPPVAGYWYFPIGDDARALATRFKVLS